MSPRDRSLWPLRPGPPLPILSTQRLVLILLCLAPLALAGVGTAATDSDIVASVTDGDTLR